MLKNGKYAAWYRTPLKQGTGIAQLFDGSITGGDSVLSYSGSYAVNGDEFTATLTTTRHSRGQQSIFGADNLTLLLEGRIVGRIARFVGTAAEFPDVPFEGTLIQSEQEQPRLDRKAPAFDPERLFSLVRYR